MEVREQVAPRWQRILQSKKKGTGQNSMNRIEHEKNCPTRMQESGRVIGGKEEVLFTPVKETGDTTVGQSVERR